MHHSSSHFAFGMKWYASGFWPRLAVGIFVQYWEKTVSTCDSGVKTFCSAPSG